MHKQLEALREVKAFLDQHAVRHLVIGGIANAVWGRPRATRDADFKVLIGERTIGEFVTLVGTQFKFRVPDPVAFARRTYVVPIYASSHIGVDLGIGFLPYEEQAVEKAVVTEYSGVTFPVCTAEDLIIQGLWEFPWFEFRTPQLVGDAVRGTRTSSGLQCARHGSSQRAIIHKAISEREKDWDDIAGVLTRQGDRLDQAYIVHWLTQFAQALERPELVQRYRDLWEKIKRTTDAVNGLPDGLNGHIPASNPFNPLPKSVDSTTAGTTTRVSVASDGGQGCWRYR